MNRQGIEGIPAHLKVVAYRPGVDGKDSSMVRYADSAAKVYRGGSFPYEQNVAVVVPDNVYGVYDLSEVKAPEYYTTGEVIEFREPIKDEEYLSPTCPSYPQRFKHLPQLITPYNDDTRRIIVKPIKNTKKVLVVEERDLGEFGDCSVYVHVHSATHGYIALRYHIEEREA